MSEQYTPQDNEYRKEGIRLAWQVGREMHDHPTAVVSRFILSGGRPELGIPPQRINAEGFPKVIDVQYMQIIDSELNNLEGLDVTQAVRISAFDFQFEDSDEIELKEQSYRIITNEFDSGVGVSRLFIVPLMDTTS